jgi:hypothetical protein
MLQLGVKSRSILPLAISALLKGCLGMKGNAIVAPNCH